MKIRTILSVTLLILTILFVSSCGEEKTPYEKNDADGYNVSVKYDANGGTFTTNTTVIVDSYNLSELPKNANGEALVALIPPDSDMKGDNAFAPVKSGHFLAGWYCERTEAGDGTYSYSNKWDFENDVLQLDAEKEYSAEDPVLTLYAVWVPMFEYRFYSLDTGEFIDSYSFNPVTDSGELKIPEWNTETGMIEMYKFPECDGYTFNGVYYDAEGTTAEVGEAVVHGGTVNYENGTSENGTVDLYIDFMEGEWYNIYTAEQFIDNASVAGSYIINADLDFEGLVWPTSLTQVNFVGNVIGNGHTFSNIKVEQTNNSKVNVGLFGHLADGCTIDGLTLDNVTVTIKAGTRVAGTSYGLFAGSISSEAKISDVTITNGKLLIDSGAYFGTDDYSIGLISGVGETDGILSYDITCEATGDAPETILITQNGTEITLEFVN